MCLVCMYTCPSSSQKRLPRISQSVVGSNIKLSYKEDGSVTFYKDIGESIVLGRGNLFHPFMQVFLSNGSGRPNTNWGQRDWAVLEEWEGKVCNICGDVGYSSCLKSCSNCHSSNEHVYCMRIHLRSVPQTWYCEACRAHTDVVSPSSGLKHSSSNMIHHDGRRFGASSSFPEQEVQTYGKQKIVATGRGSCKVPVVSMRTAAPKPVNRRLKEFIPKKVEAGKVQYLQVEGVYKLSSGATTKASCTQNAFNSQSTWSPVSGRATPNSSDATGHQSHDQISPPGVPSKLPYKPLEVYKLSSRDAEKASRKRVGFNLQSTRSPVSGCTAPNFSHPMAHRLHGQTSPSAVPFKVSTSESSRQRMEAAENVAPRRPQISSSKICFLTGTKKHNAEMHQSPSSQTIRVPPRVAYQVSNDYIDKKDLVGASVPFDGDGILYSDILFKFREAELRNCPVTEVAWKGSFEVKHSDGFYDGFQAHYPKKLSKKAYKFSKEMPGILQFKMQPHCDVWPEIFKDGSPSIEDISLYFFPGRFSSYVEKYRSLCNFIGTNDLSLRSCMGDVELLVFTSQQLPANSHKLNMNFYLWGVFHKVKWRITRAPLLDYSNLQCSLDAASKVNADRHSETATCPELVLEIKREQALEIKKEQALEIKREQQEYLDAPPGFYRPVTGDADKMGLVEKLTEAPGNPRPLATDRFSRLVTGDADKRGLVKLLEAPRGCQRPNSANFGFPPVIGAAIKESEEKSPVKMPTIRRTL